LLLLLCMSAKRLFLLNYILLKKKSKISPFFFFLFNETKFKSQYEIINSFYLLFLWNCIMLFVKGKHKNLIFKIKRKEFLWNMLSFLKYIIFTCIFITHSLSLSLYTALILLLCCFCWSMIMSNQILIISK